MIKRVHASYFKSIKEQTLEDLTPIVGIWGRNGSGKSSLFEAIVWVLKNGGDYNANGISLGGPDNFIFGHSKSNKCIVEVGLSDGREFLMRYGGGGPPIHVSREEKIRYFPPWRHISARSSNIAQEITSDLGIAGPQMHTFMHHYLHQLIGKIQRGDDEAQKIYGKINGWAEKIGFGPLLDYQQSPRMVTGTYRDKILDLEVPIFDGGYGGNSFLPILLEGYSFTDGTMLIEEPEISLHPAAQSEVLDFFVEMATERHHQIIFTSHSEYMVKRIARLLKGGEVDSDLISVYVAKKEDEDGTIFEKKDNRDLVSRFEQKQDIILELTKRN